MEKVPRPPQISTDSGIVKFIIAEHNKEHYLRWGPVEEDGSFFTHYTIRNQFLDELVKAGLKADGLGDIAGGTAILSFKKISYLGDCLQYPIADYELFRSLILSKHNDYQVEFAEIGPKQDS